MLTPKQHLNFTAGKFITQFGTEVIKGKVLDVGCGNKPYKRLFPDCEWVGLDNRPVGDIIADAHDMSVIEDNTFDTVILSNVLQFCGSPITVMAEVKRVLKPGGKVVIVVPNTWIDDRESLWNFTGRGIDYLIGSVGLKGEFLVVDGKLFSFEWKERYGGSNGNVAGWLEEMDARYPVATFAIASKE